MAGNLGLLVVTVDCAVDSDNAASVYATSRSLGYGPFVGSPALDSFVPLTS